MTMQFNSNANRFHRSHAIELTNDEIYRYAPSVFAVEKHESRTENFVAIPTIKVVDALRKEGFAVVSAQQKRTNNISKRAFTTHLLRLRHVNDVNNANT